MAFDGITTNCIMQELNHLLAGQRISKIAQPEREELLFTFKALNEGSNRLLISANASLPFLYMTKENKTSPLNAPNFCMLLRKYIGNGRISAISQPSMERVLCFTIEHLDEMGDPAVKYLYVEIMGKHSNIIFCDKDGQIIDGGKALTTDSMSSVFSGLVGAAPAAVYIESAAGTAAGGKTGLTAITVGVLFLLILFLSPLSYLVPGYATAPALMYVGLLMLSNVAKIDFADFVDAMAGLVTAVFIVLTCNIVTGIMIGFATLVIGRLVSGEWRKLNIGTVVIAVALVTFYAGGWAI